MLGEFQLPAAKLRLHASSGKCRLALSYFKGELLFVQHLLEKKILPWFWALKVKQMLLLTLLGALLTKTRLLACLGFAAAVHRSSAGDASHGVVLQPLSLEVVLPCP